MTNKKPRSGSPGKPSQNDNYDILTNDILTNPDIGENVRDQLEDDAEAYVNLLEAIRTGAISPELKHQFPPLCEEANLRRKSHEPCPSLYKSESESGPCMQCVPFSKSRKVGFNSIATKEQLRARQELERMGYGWYPDAYEVRNACEDQKRAWAEAERSHPGTLVAVTSEQSSIVDFQTIDQLIGFNCPSLITVYIPENVAKIRNQAFAFSPSLTTVHIAEGVTEIGTHAFMRCESLESVHIPQSVTKIDAHAFHGCTRLKSVDIPEGVTEIGSRAFLNCRALAEVRIPTSVQYIGTAAFEGCTELKSVSISRICMMDSPIFNGCPQLRGLNFSDGLRPVQETELNYAF